MRQSIRLHMRDAAARAYPYADHESTHEYGAEGFEIGVCWITGILADLIEDRDYAEVHRILAEIKGKED